MTEKEFLQRWHDECPMYKAWGQFVVSEICKDLITLGVELDSYLKQPYGARVKKSDALLDKAFYRQKGYQNPYDEIEDKVACRFVVLLVEQIEQIASIIKDGPHWSSIECRHFSQERTNAPMLFTYQSVHYVVKARKSFTYEGVEIKEGTPCEIQIRTLLQHAYAELTHDAIYKAKTIVEPKVHRTVAKSMALIETTDDFFSEVNNSLVTDSLGQNPIQAELDSLYIRLVKEPPTKAQKSSIVILDTFKEQASDQALKSLQKLFSNKAELLEVIRQGRDENPMYSQSIILFIVWLIIRRKRIVRRSWPINHQILERIAAKFGESFDF